MSEKREKETLEHTKKCPECSSTHISRDYSRAELVCDDCGLVVAENLIDPDPGG